eukprot:6212547-Pleurochrysis_carterae.AAC.5
MCATDPVRQVKVTARQLTLSWLKNERTHAPFSRCCQVYASGQILRQLANHHVDPVIASFRHSSLGFKAVYTCP